MRPARLPTGLRIAVGMLLGVGLMAAALLIQWFVTIGLFGVADRVTGPQALWPAVTLFGVAAIVEEAMKFAIFLAAVRHGALRYGGFFVMILVYVAIERGLNLAPLVGMELAFVWPVLVLNAGTAAMHLLLALLYRVLSAERALALGLGLHLIHNMLGVTARLGFDERAGDVTLWAYAGVPWIVPLATLMILMAARRAGN